MSSFLGFADDMEVIENKILSDSLVFKGAENNPFLAPRGIWITDNALFVSDTGQNRVFIWRSFPQSEFAAPDIVLGQEQVADTYRNAGQAVNAGSLQYPSGIWSDGQRVIIADAWNHRVLIWNSFPTANGQPADVVLGQPDVESNLPNYKGIGAEPDARTLNWPYGVHSDGRQLWVADTGNRRVLYFKTIPTSSFTPADNVIGQHNFGEKEYDAQNAVWPYSVRIGPGGQLAVTDTQYYRVLIWHAWESAFDRPADSIIGQNDLSANGQNQFRLTPSDCSLNWCYDSFFEDEGIWVADTGNSRLIWFEKVPEKNNMPADDLIGHDDFETGSENSTTVQGTENSLYWPFSLCVHQHHMAIADTGNHRIILKTKHT